MIFANLDVVTLSEEESYKLKVVFLVHFVLITFGFQGYWYPNSYLFYNSVFIGAIIWALHQNTNGLAMRMASIVSLLSIVFDVIVLGIYYPSGGRGGDIFSATMAILNLLLRPVSLMWFAYTVDKVPDPKEPLIGREAGRYQDMEAQQSNA